MQFTRNISISFIAHLGLIAALLLTGSISRIHNRHLFTVSLLDEEVKAETNKAGNRPSRIWPVSSPPVIGVKPNLKPPVAPGKAQRHESASYVSSPLAKEMPSAGHSQGIAIRAYRKDGPGIERGYSPYTGGLDASQERSKITSPAAGSGAPGQRGQAESNISFSNKIRDALQKNLIYPYLARKRKMEGSVLVSFRINQEGFPESIRTLKGSGHAILDEAAQETVRKASPFPAANSTTVEVPITFLLKDK